MNNDENNKSDNFKCKMYFTIISSNILKWIKTKNTNFIYFY